MQIDTDVPRSLVGLLTGLPRADHDRAAAPAAAAGGLTAMWTSQFLASTLVQTTPILLLRSAR